jgi:flagellar basal body rod protein FlgG
MMYGLYLSAQGAQAQTTRLDVIANNLANASTSAFKRDLAIYQAHPPYDVENGAPSGGPQGWDNHAGGLSLAGVVTDFSHGSLQRTTGTYDLALAGPGFFQVADEREQFLTRNGQFSISPTGELVTDTGLKVLNESGGTISVPANASSVEVNADGTANALLEDGVTRAALGRVAVVEPASLDSLEKVGNSLYRAHSAVAPAGPNTFVRQGYLEASGTNSVMEMLEMIQATRAFETNVNMIKHQDDALSRLLQSASLR